ncbi:hypothetical protein EDD17DRAFT_1760745 [Pisolithus thermaeus]|nr:hypothetical protein EDD17DRAFT_1760745 [Pisolithus thermaeus]
MRENGLSSASWLDSSSSLIFAVNGSVQTRAPEVCTIVTHGQASDKHHTYSTSIDDTASSDFDPSLYIVAHESDIVSGSRAVSAALALECSEVLPDGVDKTNAGSGRIRLETQHHTLVFDDDSDGVDSSVKGSRKPSPPHSLVDRLKMKYQKQNALLGQTGAGCTYEDLLSNDKTKNILAAITKDFPWWADLHGWWCTNPAYNNTFSTADIGQDFATHAVELFKLQPTPPHDGS